MGISKSIIRAAITCVIVTIIAGCSKDNNPTALSPGAISGRVTDYAGGNPIVGATVSTQPATTTATTDAQGNYSLPDLSPAIYAVSATKSSYFVSTLSVTVAARDTVAGNVILAPKIEGNRPGEARTFSLGSTNIAMVWIPAGNFQMGSPATESGRESAEGPVHTVTFANGFWMGKYEVTQGQWQAVMGSNPAGLHGVGEDYPVYNVSWNDVQAFTAQMGGIFHLPSESEWEYACRAGTTTRYFWGDDSGYVEINNHAWFIGNSDASTHSVGSKGSNGWGLFDMSGNVWEWCSDWSHNDYSGAPTDGSSWLTPLGITRALRGGSWKCPNATFSRSARRLARDPALRYDYVGVRLVCGGN